MKALVHSTLVLACALALCGTSLAKGSGGGHGSGGHGGHGSSGHGGHGSSGHSGGGHASGGGHGSSGGHAKHSTTPAGGNSGTNSRRTAGGVVVGTAVPRAPFSPVQGPLPFTNFRRFYAGPGLGYGHRLFYDPFWFGPAFGHPSDAYGYGAPSYFSGFAYAPDPFNRDVPTGSIRLMVEPKDAVVFVDGYYAGVVDDFDGHFQHLDVTAGPHHIQISAAGYESREIDVVIQARHKIDYRGTLIRPRP